MSNYPSGSMREWDPRSPEFVPAVDDEAEELVVCLACGEEITDGEAHRSETLDGPICEGCAGDGDNP